MSFDQANAFKNVIFKTIKNHNSELLTHPCSSIVELYALVNAHTIFILLSFSTRAESAPSAQKEG